MREKARAHYKTTVAGPFDAKPTRAIALAHALSATHLDHEPSFDHYKNDMYVALVFFLFVIHHIVLLYLYLFGHHIIPCHTIISYHVL